MKIPFLFLSLLFAYQIQAQNSPLKAISSFEEYAQALEEAKRNDQMIFVALFDNGESSKQVKVQNAFSSPSFSSFFNGYVPLEFNANSNIGKRWLQAFAVEELPSFFVLNKNEVILESIDGYQDVNALEKLLSENVENKNLYQTLNTKYGTGELSPSEWTKLLYIHSLNFDFNQTRVLALEYLNTLNDFTLLDPKVIPVLTRYGIDLETRYPKLILDKQKEIKTKWNDFDVDQWFQTAYSYNLDRALFNKDSTLIKKIANPLILKSEETDKAALTLTTYQLFVEETQQFSLLLEAVMDYTSEITDSAKRARFIFDQAFEIADKNEDPKAFKVSRELAKQASIYGTDFRFKMLESYTAYELGDMEDAEKLANEAKSIAVSVRSKDKADNLIRLIRSKSAEEKP